MGVEGNIGPLKRGTKEDAGGRCIVRDCMVTIVPGVRGMKLGECEMDRTCRTNVRYVKCLQKFGQKT
jgi:hypothetical protein